MKAPWTVLGSGAWGTALAMILAGNGHLVSLWTRNRAMASKMASTRENARYLPGIPLPREMEITSDMEIALKTACGVVFAIPSQSLREVATEARPFMTAGQMAISASKGLEVPTLKRITEVLQDEMPKVPAGTISGPNFAEEVARGVPTATVVASDLAELSLEAQQAFMAPNFRVYTNSDVVGVELGGALKNIYAIGVGIIDGMDLGHNTRAAFMTRALTELVRLGMAMGAEPRTFSGLSGIGDLILTATGNLSRNRRCGIELGKGKDLEGILRETRMVVEGVQTTKAARTLASSLGVEMPLVDGMYSILFDRRKPREVLNKLMTRGAKGEVEELPGEAVSCCASEWEPVDPTF